MKRTGRSARKYRSLSGSGSVTDQLKVLMSGWGKSEEIQRTVPVDPAEFDDTRYPKRDRYFHKEELIFIHTMDNEK